MSSLAASLDRFFHLTERGSSVRTEVIAGLTTFLTMAYIVFVQPAVLSAAGMDAGAVLVATCIASAIGTLLMGLLANYPIGVAPAMGHNFFFAFTVVIAGGTPWRTALGAVAIAGLVFILTAGFGLRERLMIAVPDPIKHAIGAGDACLLPSRAVRFDWHSHRCGQPNRRGPERHDAAREGSAAG